MLGESFRQRLRDSYVCDCGPRTVPVGRLTSARLDTDPGEKILSECEEATGTRPSGCPWRALRDPYVAQVVRSHRWWKAGQLADRWGGEIPASIVWGIDVYDAALNAVLAHDAREDRKKPDPEPTKPNVVNVPAPRRTGRSR